MSWRTGCSSKPLGALPLAVKLVEETDANDFDESFGASGLEGASRRRNSDCRAGSGGERGGGICLTAATVRQHAARLLAPLSHPPLPARGKLIRQRRRLVGSSLAMNAAADTASSLAFTPLHERARERADGPHAACSGRLQRCEDECEEECDEDAAEAERENEAAGAERETVVEAFRAVTLRLTVRFEEGGDACWRLTVCVEPFLSVFVTRALSGTAGPPPKFSYV